MVRHTDLKVMLHDILNDVENGEKWPYRFSLFTPEFKPFPTTGTIVLGYIVSIFVVRVR
jgi:hypothetical protein